VKGDSVKWVQWSLNKIMNTGLGIDGSCGPKTVEAIKAFQKKYGLAVDGSFGSESRGKMTSLLSAKGWS
jgi:peptidoglycan hydrolase-like protein with peptidoglycan-binding domain